MTANKTRKPIAKQRNYETFNKGRELKKLILDFLEYLEIEKAASQYTIRNYNFYLNRFLDWIVKNNSADKLRDIDLDNIRKYRVYLSRLSNRGKRLSKVTQAYHIIALRSWFRWLIKNDFDIISPDRIDLPSAESRKVEFLNKEQVERLLNQPSISKIGGLRDKVILETLFSTGLRVSELTALNRDQIDLERREFGVVGKGGRTRVVFLSARSAVWIERYLKARKDKWIPLFVRFSQKLEDLNSKGEGMRLSVRSVQRVVNRYCMKAKLPIKITPHGLRHSFATDLLQSGAGLREVQEMLGHKNVTTTQIYTHVTNPQLKKVHEKYHSGNK